MNTIAASQEAIETNRLPTKKAKASLDAYLKADIESCSCYTSNFVETEVNNMLVGAANLAFAEHYPLTLTPDIIWLTLTQGLASHINLNGEKLRKEFVSHEGKKKIVVRRDSFIRKSPENDWGGCINEFSQKIKTFIGDETHKVIVADFSTTDETAKVASEITLMDAMKTYFEYVVFTKCGIPYINVEGTPDDWQNMHDRVGKWSKWGLDWWVPSVQEVLSEFVLAARGEANSHFWQSFYKEQNMSGGNKISGWINTLFPYIEKRRSKELTKNEFINWRKGGHFNGNDNTCFPTGVASAPFVWDYYGTQYDYKFVGGLVGIEQNKDMTLMPKIGWVVMEDSK